MANPNPDIAVQLISEIILLTKGVYYLVTKSAEADKKWMGNLGLKGSIATESSIERIK